MKIYNKLFLESFTAYVVDDLVKFINILPKKVSIAFISTAADPYQDKWFVEKDKEALLNKGFKITDVDIKNKKEKVLYKLLVNFDLIFVSGGNAFYLLEKSLESGFDKVIKKLLRKGLIYVGSSAGSAIVGPSLEAVITLDDPKLGPNLKNYNGFGIVDFTILPHYGDPKYEGRYKKIVGDFTNSKYKVIPLTNQQAIQVVGDDYKIIESKQTSTAVLVQ